MTQHREPVLIDGMPCPYCSPGCETRGLPEHTIKDNHVVCFCPCHRLAEVLVTITRLEAEYGRLELERDELLAQRDAFGQKAHQLQEKLNEITPPLTRAGFEKAIENLTREPAPIDSGKVGRDLGHYPCSKCFGQHFTGECPNS